VIFIEKFKEAKIEELRITLHKAIDLFILLLKE
jgi:hypothetical protein